MNTENENEEIIPDDNELILECSTDEGYDDSNSQMSILIDNLNKYLNLANGEQDDSEKWKQSFKENLVPESIHKLVLAQFKLKLKCMIQKDKNLLKRLKND